MDQTGIKIEDLHLSFGETQVLRGVNLDIRPGEFFAFLGPSGSGKSTLLRAIAGFGPTPHGRILIGDRDVVGLDPWKRNVGMVFQSYALWPHMSVRDNVGFGLRERRVPAKQIRDRVDAALDLVGLAHLADRMPNQLSGGSNSVSPLRARSLSNPRFCCWTNRCRDLDASLRVQMRRELLHLQRKLGLTTIFVTHDQEEANTTSDRMAVLDGGVIQQIGTPQELYDRPANLFVANFLGTANIFEGRVEIDGDVARFHTKTGEVLTIPASGNLDGSNVVLRPQNISMTQAPEQDALKGEVLHREFLGSQIRYLVKVAGAEIVVDQSHSAGRDWFDPGAQVHLVANTSSAVIL